MVCERGIKCSFVLSCVVKYSCTIGGSRGLRVGRTLSCWSDGSWNANTRENEASSVFLKHMNSLLWVELEVGWCCHDCHCPTASLVCGGWIADSGATARPFWTIIEFRWITVGHLLKRHVECAPSRSHWTGTSCASWIVTPINLSKWNTFGFGKSEYLKAIQHI